MVRRQAIPSAHPTLTGKLLMSSRQLFGPLRVPMILVGEVAAWINGQPPELVGCINREPCIPVGAFSKLRRLPALELGELMVIRGQYFMVTGALCSCFERLGLLNELLEAHLIGTGCAGYQAVRSEERGPSGAVYRSCAHPEAR